MKKAKKERLEAAGWRVGTAEEFLGLSKEEAAFVEMKLALAEASGGDARRNGSLRRSLRSGSGQVSREWPRWKQLTLPSRSICC